jgi:hypothetical protein
MASLNAYRDRNEDPFYKIHHFDSNLSDSGDEYVLRVRAPSHERSNLRVSIVGHEILLSGQRKNEDFVKTSEGGRVSSTSFQSFKQTFPVDYPVEAKMIYQEVDGEDVVFHLPKAGPKARKVHESPYEKIERLEATQKPFFPKNLPESKT